MDEVNVNAVDRRCELRQRVEPGFGFAPVVPGGPVPHEFAERSELQALRPVINRFAVGQARRSDALAKVNQCLLGEADAKRTNYIVRFSQSAVKRKQGSRTGNCNAHRSSAQQCAPILVDNFGNLRPVHVALRCLIRGQPTLVGACDLNVAGERKNCSLGVVKRCYRLLTLKKFAVRQSMEPAAAGSGNEFEQG
jgi:hypothetical protein